MNETVIALKRFMGEHDLTIEDVAKKIDKSPKTVWLFLHQRVKPHTRTLYRIEKMLGLQ